MDSDIQFGSVAETSPVRELRPDANPHYRVVAVGEPREDDLPIFIDLDVAREIETHGRSNMEVELGGVLLGGQFVDDDGRPFVVVRDSLRAQHFEATRGSFKFTHETWEAISRERERFPREARLVGWYHTHPGWGVFLSEPDQFICRHFFARPLDVALVVDPCRGDRGWFQWTSAAPDEPRRTGGFYLFASRFRQTELAEAAALWGVDFMNHRSTEAGERHNSPPAAPSVHVIERAPAWHSLAVLGVLVTQMALVAVLAWRVLTPPGRPVEAVAITKGTTDLPSDTLALEREKARREAQSELIDRVLADLRETPRGTFDHWRQTDEELKDLKASLRGQTALIEQLEAQGKKKADEASRRLAESMAERDRWKRGHEELQSRFDEQAAAIARLRHERTTQSAQAADGDRETSTAAASAADTADARPTHRWTMWQVGLAAGGVLAGLAIGAALIWKKSAANHLDGLSALPAPAEESPRGTAV